MPEYGWGKRLFEIGLIVGKIYQYVFVIFLTALIGAMLGRFGDMLLLPTKTELSGGWTAQHWLWICGAVVAVIGYPLGWIKINGKKFDFRIWSGWSKIDPRTEQETGTDSTNELKKEKPAKVLSSAAFFGFVGAFLGLFLGGSFLLIWFSLALSPWPPEGWMESLTENSADLSAPRVNRDHQEGLSTSHPVAVYCFLGPIVVLGTLGAFIGAIGAACGWVKDFTTRSRST